MPKSIDEKCFWVSTLPVNRVERRTQQPTQNKTTASRTYWFDNEVEEDDDGGGGGKDQQNR